MPCEATRRIRGTASWVVLAMLAGGCKWVPVRPVENPRTLTTVASTAGEKEPELPPLPILRSIADEEAFTPAPTPLLDAAAERDEAVKRAIAVKTVSDTASIQQALRLETAALEDAPAKKLDPTVEPASFVPPKPEEASPIANEPVDSESPLWQYVLSAMATASTLEPEIPREPEFFIADLRICKRVLGFGRTEPIAAEALVAGSHLLLYCEIEGVRDEEDSQGYRSRIASSLAILPASGGDAVWQFDLGNAEDHCQRRRRDFFVNYRVTIPPTLPPGEYQIRLVQKDMLASREASRSLPLTVRAK